MKSKVENVERLVEGYIPVHAGIAGVDPKCLVFKKILVLPESMESGEN